MLILDGHNLIGRSRGLSLDREAEGREALLRRLAAWGRRGVTVVFDGNRPGARKTEKFGGVRVVYSPAGRSADDEVLALLDRGNPRACTVVTSDRRLASEAAARGARVETSEDFLARLGRRRRPSAAEPRAAAPEAGEVEEWLRLFQGGHKM